MTHFYQRPRMLATESDRTMWTSRVSHVCDPCVCDRGGVDADTCCRRTIAHETKPLVPAQTVRERNLVTRREKGNAQDSAAMRAR